MVDRPSSTMDDGLTRRRDDRSAAARKIDSQRLDLVVHDARADAEQLGGVLLDPVRHPESFQQGAPLDFLQWHAGWRNLDERGWLARAGSTGRVDFTEPKIVGGDELPLGHEYGALDRVLELAN